MVEIVAKANRLDVLQWVHNRGHEVRNTKQVHRSQEEVHRLFTDEFILSYISYMAAFHDNLEMLQWVRSIDIRISTQSETAAAAEAAARGGKLDTLRWLHYNMDYALHSGLIELAFPEHPNVVRWLRKQKVPWPMWCRYG